MNLIQISEPTNQFLSNIQKCVCIKSLKKIQHVGDFVDRCFFVDLHPCAKTRRCDHLRKLIYMSYWGQNRGVPQPVANQEFMPVSGIKPKAKLKKYYVDYAVNLQVTFLR